MLLGRRLRALAHPQSWGKVMTFLILLLPITTAATFSPDSFSASVVNNRGVITDASGLRARGTTPQPPPELPLPSNNTTAAPATPAPATPDQTAQQPPTAPQDYLQRTPDGLIIAEVLDLLYAAQDNLLRKDFEEKQVQLIGQLMPDASNNAKGNRFKAVRMFMTCCAADARPVATLVEADKKPDSPRCRGSRSRAPRLSRSKMDGGSRC